MPGALRGLVGIKDLAARHEAVRAFIASLPATSLSEMFNAFERLESEGDFRQHQNTARAAASTWELIVASMVEQGPEDFLDLKLHQAGEQASETEFESVLSAWAEKDLDATVAYFNANIRHLQPSELQGAAGHLTSDFLRLDPERSRRPRRCRQRDRIRRPLKKHVARAQHRRPRALIITANPARLRPSNGRAHCRPT